MRKANGELMYVDDESGFERILLPVEEPELTADELAIAQHLKDAIPSDDESIESAHSDVSIDHFGSAEHIAIGNEAFQLFCDRLGPDFLQNLIAHQLAEKEVITAANGDNPEKYKVKLKISETVRITAGQIVALAGDFFGVPEEPIWFGVNRDRSKAENDAECKRRFQAAYNTLVQAQQDDVNNLLSLIAIEEQAINEALDRGEKPNIVLESLESSQNKKYANLTRYTFFPTPWVNLSSKYMDLAVMNFDHFGEEAKIAYGTGHKLAIETVRNIPDSVSAEEKMRLLVLALTQELYACHFFTDLFASGHVRTPRKEIVEHVQNISCRIVPKKQGIAGLLVKEMHDEDGRLGLMMHSKNQENRIWEAKGDSCYHEQENRDNADIVCAAVADALMCIYNAFMKKPINDVAYLDYIPEVVSPTIVTEGGKRSHFPLFKVDPSKALGHRVERRKNVDDPACDKYISDWSPVQTLIECKMKPLRSKTNAIAARASALGHAVADPIAEEIKNLQEDIQDLSENGCRMS